MIEEQSVFSKYDPSRHRDLHYLTLEQVKSDAATTLVRSAAMYREQSQRLEEAASKVPDCKTVSELNDLVEALTAGQLHYTEKQLAFVK